MGYFFEFVSRSFRNIKQVFLGLFPATGQIISKGLFYVTIKIFSFRIPNSEINLIFIEFCH